MTAPTVRVATFAELDTTTLYALLKLRVDVFVVEQACAYPELDGRDAEPGTRHLWIDGTDRADPADRADRTGRADPADRTDGPDAYLRLLTDPGDVARIGRVVVAPRARAAGLATTLMTAALELVGQRPCVLDAQAHLAGYYGRLGFTATGPRYVEDGIPHLPMRRAGGTSQISEVSRTSPASEVSPVRAG